jgi:hypothetical protein
MACPSASGLCFNCEVCQDEAEKKKQERNRKARERRAAYRDALDSLGMKEVRGAQGGRFIE